MAESDGAGDGRPDVADVIADGIAIDEETADRLLAGRTVASAESLTGGLVAAKLVAIPGSGSWFRGGVVAYRSEVKFEVLGVRRGPVVCEEAAVEMARGVRRVIGADIGLATTGVAGPAEQEGCEVGTVFIAVAVGERVVTDEYHFPGDPDEVRERTVEEVVGRLFAALADTPVAGAG